ncbi:MAG: hypothetical protein F4X18_12175 [Acidimicrobiia bacterium]|nr:hypothetical protein [Acidimicrobiia bacterium]MYB44491.1 hypothetical protein [Acidimicrobiia bacterium]MYC86249.1 hypothetical protein [Acidimicrobiia bacterium]
MKSINAVAVGLGAVAGLLSMVFAGLIGLAVLWLGARAGIDTGDTITWAVLAVALFGGEHVAGYVAGRLVPPFFARMHGAVAALTVYAVVATFSLVAGSPAGPLTLGGFALVAAVIGHVAGAVGGRHGPSDQT